MATDAARETTRGLWAAFFSFVLWGVMPLYWHLLKSVPSLQILLHRIAWSAVFVGAFLLWRDGRHWLRLVLAQPRLWWMLGLSSLLISVNWGLCIWAVNAGHVVETSLGYFINPLLNVLLGVVFLRERLRPAQWLSVALAAAGVAWLTLQFGRPPWIALTLGVSFALYGLVRKLTQVDSVAGLGVESVYLLPVAVGALAWIGARGGTVFGPDAASAALLVFAGVLTALPLIGFAHAVRRVPLTTVGLMQYIAPTLQLLVGVLVLGEAFDRERAVGFVLIWVALAVFAGEGLWRARANAGNAAPSPLA
jgi:chloramphenicol-sensitive protein RarD